jgi:uncharacterized protein DUF2188
VTTFRRLVVPATRGGWNVLKPGAKRASSHHPTQADAARRAWEIVHNHGGGEIVLYRASDPAGGEAPPAGAPPAESGRG